jgi:hypothetical protein
MSPINMKIEHKHSSSSSNSGAPGSDQYPPRTSYQEAATALIDSYRPTPGDPGNQRLPSSHKADSRQNLEKYPAEALREQGRSRTGRENGRLSPVRDIEMESGLHTGVKRESDGSPAAKEDMQQLFLRPQSKRLRAADFMDVGDDHYP